MLSLAQVGTQFSQPVTAALADHSPQQYCRFPTSVSGHRQAFLLRLGVSTCSSSQKQKLSKLSQSSDTHTHMSVIFSSPHPEKRNKHRKSCTLSFFSLVSNRVGVGSAFPCTCLSCTPGHKKRKGILLQRMRAVARCSLSTGGTAGSTPQTSHRLFFVTGDCVVTITTDL